MQAEAELEPEVEAEVEPTPEPKPEPETEAKAEAKKPAAVKAKPEKLHEIPDVAVPAPEPEVASSEPAGSQHIRVNADLLDSLVNSAGEISIFRSHLEQQVGQIRDNLKEFDVTVSRIREQFRKLEIETETQIGSRYHQEAPGQDLKSSTHWKWTGSLQCSNCPEVCRSQWPTY